jgi:hypothetical protein
MLTPLGEIRRDEGCLDFAAQSNVTIQRCHELKGNQEWIYDQVCGFRFLVGLCTFDDNYVLNVWYLVGIFLLTLVTLSYETHVSQWILNLMFISNPHSSVGLKSFRVFFSYCRELVSLFRN